MSNLMMRIKDCEVEIEAEGTLTDVVANWAYLTRQLRNILRKHSDDNIEAIFRTALEFSEIYKTPKERGMM